MPKLASEVLYSKEFQEELRLQQGARLSWVTPEEVVLAGKTVKNCKRADWKHIGQRVRAYDGNGTEAMWLRKYLKDPVPVKARQHIVDTAENAAKPAKKAKTDAPVVTIGTAGSSARSSTDMMTLVKAVQQSVQQSVQEAMKQAMLQQQPQPQQQNRLMLNKQAEAALEAERRSLAKREESVAEREAEVAVKEAELEAQEKEAELEVQERVEERETEVAERQSGLEEKEAELEEREEALAEKEEALEEKDKALAKQVEEVFQEKSELSQKAETLDRRKIRFVRAVKAHEEAMNAKATMKADEDGGGGEAVGP